MKSVAQIQTTLAKQWQQSHIRIARLLEGGWPVTLAIGRPKSADIVQRTHAVKSHQQAWQAFAEQMSSQMDLTAHSHHGITSNSGIEVTWESHTYRGTGSAITYPDSVTITTAEAWQASMAKGESQRQIAHYLNLFHRLFAYESIKPLLGYSQISVDKSRYSPPSSSSANQDLSSALTQKASSLFDPANLDPILKAQLALLLGQLKLVMTLDVVTLIQLLVVTNLLTPACASGVPLRSLDMGRIVRAVQASSTLVSAKAGGQTVNTQQCWLGVLQASPELSNLDSKFFARHGGLLTRLLDTRFDGKVSQIGLEGFLQASASGKHWLLLYEADWHHNAAVTTSPHKHWLPFATMRVSDTDLTPDMIPTIAKSQILIIENEQCLHLLPPLPDTLVILGAGRNLAWLAHGAWAQKRLWYWGDIDTWGLAMLSEARRHQPSLQPVMMDEATFNHHTHAIVTEPTSYPNMPDNLTAAEQRLFRRLQGSHDVASIKTTIAPSCASSLVSPAPSAQRLEQEFIHFDWVAQALKPLMTND